MLEHPSPIYSRLGSELRVDSKLERSRITRSLRGTGGSTKKISLLRELRMMKRRFIQFCAMHTDTSSHLFILLLSIMYLHHLHHTMQCIIHSMSTILSNRTHLIDLTINGNGIATRQPSMEFKQSRQKLHPSI